MLLIPLSVIALLALLAALSYRLGAVLRYPPHYRLFFVGVLGVVAGAGLWVSLGGDHAEIERLQTLIAVVPLLVALLIGVVVAWYYWGWLLYE